MIDKYWPVLDNGFVALKDYMGSDDSIERAARVSYSLGTRPKRDTRNLIRYLMRNAHTSPFEHVEFQFHIAMPIFVARQWVRHRTANLNEWSGRYSVMPNLFYSPDWKYQSTSNKQGTDKNVNDVQKQLAQNLYDSSVGHSKDVYNHLIDGNIAREQARVCLPVSVYTYMYWKMDLHNLFHFLKLRLDEHAQWEIREYAKVIAGIIKEIVPISFEAFVDYKLNAKVFSHQELVALGLMLSKNTPQEYASVLSEANMNDREKEELVGKLGPSEYPDFTLDESMAKTYEHFEKLIQGA